MWTPSFTLCLRPIALSVRCLFARYVCVCVCVFACVYTFKEIIYYYYYAVHIFRPQFRVKVFRVIPIYFYLALLLLLPLSLSTSSLPVVFIFFITFLAQLKKKTTQWHTHTHTTNERKTANATHKEQLNGWQHLRISSFRVILDKWVVIIYFA